MRKMFQCHDLIMVYIYIYTYTAPNRRPGGWFNMKMSSYPNRKSHCGDKTISQPSYLHNGFSNTGKTTSLYWIRALAYMAKLVMSVPDEVTCQAAMPLVFCNQPGCMHGGNTCQIWSDSTVNAYSCHRSWCQVENVIVMSRHACEDLCVPKAGK